MTTHSASPARSINCRRSDEIRDHQKGSNQNDGTAFAWGHRAVSRRRAICFLSIIAPGVCQMIKRTYDDCITAMQRVNKSYNTPDIQRNTVMRRAFAKQAAENLRSCDSIIRGAWDEGC